MKHRRFTVLTAAIGLSIVLMPMTSYADATPTYTFKNQIGSQAGVTHFTLPYSGTPDNHGHLFIADQSDVIETTMAGDYVATIGAGVVSNVNDIEVAANGNLYVVSGAPNGTAPNDSVAIFAPNGTLLTQFGAPGTGDGEFGGATAIAIAPTGNLYVTDTGNDRVEVFTSNGTYLAQFGGTGSLDGEFSSPAGIAVDAQGTIFVADQNNHRIEAFDSLGLFSYSFNSFSGQAGVVAAPYGLTINADGNLVFDASSQIIYITSPNGTSISESLSPTSVPQLLHADNAGRLYLGSYSAIFVLDSSLNETNAIVRPNILPGQLDDGGFVLAGKNHDVYELDVGYYNTYNVTRFDSNGTFLNWIAPRNGSGPDTIMTNALTAFAVGPDDDLYLTSGYTIKRFSPDGTLKSQFDLPMNLTNGLDAVLALTIAPDGTIYIEDDVTDQILKFSPDGTLLGVFLTYTSSAGDLNGTTSSGLAVNAAGDLYAADVFNDRVLEYGPDGTRINSFGSTGTGDGQFQYTYAVNLGPDGNVYVADALNNRVQVFTADGAYITSLSDPHTTYATSVSTDPYGVVYIGDIASRTVAAYTTDGFIPPSSPSTTPPDNTPPTTVATPVHTSSAHSAITQVPSVHVITSGSDATSTTRVATPEPTVSDSPTAPITPEQSTNMPATEPATSTPRSGIFSTKNVSYTIGILTLLTGLLLLFGRSRRRRS